MSMSFQIKVYGYATKAELKEYNGAQCCTFSQAATRSVPKERRDGTPIPCPTGWAESYNGKRWETTAWIRWTAWHGLARQAYALLKDGGKARVTGVLNGESIVNDKGQSSQNPRVWTGRDGVSRSSYEGIVEKIVPQGVPASERTGGNGGHVGEPPPDIFSGGDDSGDDPLPF